MKKIYGFYKGLWAKDALAIKEFEVVKETEKQYKIKGGYPTTIFKRTMEVGDYKFYETKDEAVEGLIDYCKQSTSWCEDAIKREEAKINKYQEVIKANTK